MYGYFPDADSERTGAKATTWGRGDSGEIVTARGSSRKRAASISISGSANLSARIAFSPAAWGGKVQTADAGYRSEEKGAQARGGPSSRGSRRESRKKVLEASWDGGRGRRRESIGWGHGAGGRAREEGVGEERGVGGREGRTGIKLYRTRLSGSVTSCRSPPPLLLPALLPTRLLPLSPPSEAESGLSVSTCASPQIFTLVYSAISLWIDSWSLSSTAHSTCVSKAAP